MPDHGGKSHSSEVINASLNFSFFAKGESIFFPFGKEGPYFSPLWKRGVRGDLRGTMLRYNKSFKEYSRSLRVNMTEAERLLWVPKPLFSKEGNI
jgi:hypothetical protein